ncbi:MAG: isoleucine--tRNA ligase [Cyclobacteriaceae bacterium]|nr:isoleucine--tRNA ligase [Cyclobacteriaceae bacterium]
MSARYKEYKELDFAKIASEVLTFWEENKIFEESISRREGKPTFTFYEGPPSANGTPGIHHVMARTVKDIFCRFKTFEGYQVKRKGGWDTHGLPVELQVEKELGITKDDIGVKISVEDYNRKCRETVMKYKNQWNDLTVKMGYWVDLEHPYVTYENDYIESLWWLLKQLYEKGLLYKGYSIQPYSPTDGTGLSSHELNLPGCYKDVKDTSITAQFKVIKDSQSLKFIDGDEELFILAWTTTPWTLPGNCALAVGEKIEYVKVKTYNAYTFKPVSVILAKERLNAYFDQKSAEADFDSYKGGDKVIPYKVVGSYSGKDLLGIKYEQLLPYVKPEGKAFVVIAGDFVSTEDGTGIVHTASLFGADDFRVCKENNISAITVKDELDNDVPVVNKQGKFVKEITDFAGMFVREEYYPDSVRNDPEFKSTDVLIAIKLKEENKAFRVEKYLHSYPHSWRTDKPVLYYPLDSWFIKTTALKHRMVELNKTINWKPASTGTGRFGNWLENLVDWNLSRSRYWGTPLPIWRTKDGKTEKCIGSLEELRKEVEHAKKFKIENTRFDSPEFDLHRPFVDEVVLADENGEPMYRESDLIDVWFDSGAMPYAQLHYPFENKEVFAKSYPADFIAEGVDQTRGWFFTLHAIASMLFDSVAFKNVISNGLVLDKNGNKMSKSKGNVVNPFETIEKYGPDVVRWYMIENAPPWDNLKFDEDGIVEVKRRFFGTLLNTYSFFALYANIDGFVKDEADKVSYDKLSHLDRWIISKLQSLIIEVTAAYNDYEPTKAARAIQDFVNDHLSNWYVRLNRKRFWQPTAGDKVAMTENKKAAYETLYECIMVVGQLMAPIAPFFSEWLYKNLTDNIREKAKGNNTPLQYPSVHLTDLMKAEKEKIDGELEQSMEYAQRISSLVHSIRKGTKIKVRTPLQKVMLPVLDDQFASRVKSVEEIIKAEVNVKGIEYIDDASGVLVKKVKPNFAKLGRQYGAKMKDVAAVINSFTKEDIAAVEKGTLTKGGFDFVVDDVIISSEDIPGWSVASEGGITVALDITITDELKREGIARDFVNRIQNLRKEMGLEVLDKISIEVEKGQNGSASVTEALTQFKDYISTETQALSLELKEQVKEATEVDMDEFMLKVKISVK